MVARRSGTLKKPKGTEDILPPETKLWQQLEDVARKTFERAGFREIRTPIFEATSLFVRTIGEATDIVEKQMYTFESAKASSAAGAPSAGEPNEEKESFTLRPEATAPVVRAYLEHNLHKTRQFQKLYYIGPMFRYERPQAGRSRQFHQLGAEAIGSLDPLLDAEMTSVVVAILRELGLSDWTLRINSIGHKECRTLYRELLRKELSGKREKLCENCQRRLERNIFRVLDCKEDLCRAVYEKLPPIVNYLCKDCADHLQEYRRGLEALHVGYRLDNHLVRGFDYYTRTVFEFTHPALGAQDAIAAGGRYDDLVEEIGGPSLGAVGFALGIERTLRAVKSSGKSSAWEEGTLPVYVVTVDRDSRLYALEVVEGLRKAGYACDMDYEARSLKAQMRQASRLGARFALAVGPEERRRNSVTLKDMTTGTEQLVSREYLAELLKKIEKP